MNRRSFVTTSVAGMAAQAVMGANERINLALIGARNQGKGVARRAIAAGARIKTVCDIDTAIYDAVAPGLAEAQGEKPGFVADFRKVLDDKDVDAVVIATPDHWHTRMSLMALQAGKDLFIEKPLSQTIQEGQWIRDAARKYNRVVQVGTMRRSGPHFIEAAEYVASGRLGKIALVRCWQCQVRESIGNPPDAAPPATADYEQWLGPAPKRPFNQNRFHYNWRFFWDYGNSELGNQGVHMIDVALMGIQKLHGMEASLPRKVSGHAGIYWLDDAKEVPDTQVTTFDYGKFLLVWELQSFASHHPIEGAGNGTTFYGTDATLSVDGNGWRVYDRKKKIAASGDARPLAHEKNFLDCLRSRQLPNSDVEIGRLSTTLCHLGNIATHLKRDVVFDPKTETFGSDEQANALLRKSYRKGYEPPSV